MKRTSTIMPTGLTKEFPVRTASKHVIIYVQLGISPYHLFFSSILNFHSLHPHQTPSLYTSLPMTRGLTIGRHAGSGSRWYVLPWLLMLEMIKFKRAGAHLDGDRR